MDVTLRAADPADEPLLWTMLFEAAHAADDGIAGPDGLRSIPELARYVEGWGRPSDLGVIALGADREPIGAAWCRLFTADRPGYAYIDGDTPELAIAVADDRRGQGVGRLMLDRLLDDARGRFTRVCLSVRADNPARRLYEAVGFGVVDGSAIPNRGGGTSITMTRVLTWPDLGQ